MRGNLTKRAITRRVLRPSVEFMEGRVLLSSATFRVLDNWGSGLTGEITIANTNSTPVNTWKLEFDYSSNLSSIWNAQIVSHSGNHYVIVGASWNKDIAPKGTVTFGFVANPGGTATPSNYRLNGVAIGGGGTNPPPSTPSLTISDVSVAEGQSGTTNAAFVVSLSAASNVSVTVPFATADGTAQAGSDYQSASGTITFAPGETSKAITVKVVGDSIHESNETFSVNLTKPSNATLARGQATGTILDDDPVTQPVPPSGVFQYTVTSDWGSGFNGQISAKNTSSTTLSNWRLEFDLPATISSIWDAQIVSRSGNRYTVKGAGWNDTIAPGASVSFGLTASPGNLPVGATNLVLSGSGTGGGGQTDPSAPLPPGIVWPLQVFAPYVDMTLYPMYDLVSVSKAQDLKFFTLAFVVADANNQPAWGGYSTYGVGDGGEFDTAMRNQIAGVRAQGGDVMVSFGGAANQELADVITDVTALKAAYKKVIDTYKLTNVDFDIEGGAQTNKAAIDRRSQALAALQQEAIAAGTTLSVHLTLPVLPTGLTNDGLYVVQSALAHGLILSGVNIMAMDYGDSAAPNPQGKMGDYAIQAATSTFGQLKAQYGTSKTDSQIWALVGVTPMIGMNDVQSEIFDQQEANELVAFAKEKKLGLLSFWSLHRDRQNPNGAINYVEISSSSILQKPFEFSTIFKLFMS